MSDTYLTWFQWFALCLLNASLKDCKAAPYIMWYSILLTLLSDAAASVHEHPDVPRKHNSIKHIVWFFVHWLLHDNWPRWYPFQLLIMNIVFTNMEVYARFLHLLEVEYGVLVRLALGAER